jgi:hypothetical protein
MLVLVSFCWSWIVNNNDNDWGILADPMQGLLVNYLGYQLCWDKLLLPIRTCHFLNVFATHLLKVRFRGNCVGRLHEHLKHQLLLQKQIVGFSSGCNAGT